MLGALAEEGATPNSVAATLGLDPVGTEALLTALATLGYVETDADGIYSPTTAGGRLVTGVSHSVAHFVGAYNAYAWDMLSGLDEVLLGEKAPASHQRPPGDHFWESYIRGLLS